MATPDTHGPRRGGGAASESAGMKCKMHSQERIRNLVRERLNQAAASAG